MARIFRYIYRLRKSHLTGNYSSVYEYHVLFPHFNIFFYCVQSLLKLHLHVVSVVMMVMEIAGFLWRMNEDLIEHPLCSVLIVLSVGIRNFVV